MQTYRENSLELSDITSLVGSGDLEALAVFEDRFKPNMTVGCWIVFVILFSAYVLCVYAS